LHDYDHVDDHDRDHVDEKLHSAAPCRSPAIDTPRKSRILPPRSSASGGNP
jgi:hypothetical protein